MRIHTNNSPAHRPIGESDTRFLPRLVQTGLDLVEFPTSIFYEPEYSVYLIQQASRRTWRLGQTQRVKIYFAVYEGTMEHRAVAHVGKKIAAAQLLYGDDVAGALVDQAGVVVGDFQDTSTAEAPTAPIFHWLPRSSATHSMLARSASSRLWKVKSRFSSKGSQSKSRKVFGAEVFSNYKSSSSSLQDSCSSPTFETESSSLLSTPPSLDSEATAMR